MAVSFSRFAWLAVPGARCDTLRGNPTFDDREQCGPSLMTCLLHEDVFDADDFWSQEGFKITEIAVLWVFLLWPQQVQFDATGLVSLN